jgi:hypothetical protein
MFIIKTTELKSQQGQNNYGYSKLSVMRFPFGITVKSQKYNRYIRPKNAKMSG